MTMEEARRYCLKLERGRERSWRKTRQGMFESAMLSFDRVVEGMGDPSRCAALSDGGAGADAIIAQIDGETPETVYNQRIRRARMRVRRHLPESLEVFNLIVKNGKNRKESICALMSKEAATGTPPTAATGIT